MRVGFLGYTSSESAVLADSSLSLADNRMQQAYIRQLQVHFGDIAVFSTSRGPVGPVVEDGILTHHAPSRNGLIGGLSRLVASYRFFARWAVAPEPKVLVCYNTFSLYALVLTLVQLRFGVRTLAIAITLPYDYGTPARNLSGRAHRILSRILLRRLNGVVAITEPLARQVNPKAPSAIIRGAVPPETIAERAPVSRSTPLRLAYAGTLYDRYNLRSLVSMMDLLGEGVADLHLYGRGPLAEWLDVAASGRRHIHVHGALPLAELRVELELSDVMLVLLDPSDGLARFSFPSKIFEAMATGRPVLVSDLDTLDPEMRRFLPIAKDLSPAGLAAEVLALKDMPEEQWQSIGQAQLRYLSQAATWPAVGRTLASLVNRIAA